MINGAKIDQNRQKNKMTEKMQKIRAKMGLGSGPRGVIKMKQTIFSIFNEQITNAYYYYYYFFIIIFLFFTK